MTSSEDWQLRSLQLCSSVHTVSFVGSSVRLVKVKAKNKVQNKKEKEKGAGAKGEEKEKEVAKHCLRARMECMCLKMAGWNKASASPRFLASSDTTCHSTENAQRELNGHCAKQSAEKQRKETQSMACAIHLFSFCFLLYLN